MFCLTGLVYFAATDIFFPDCLLRGMGQGLRASNGRLLIDMHYVNEMSRSNTYVCLPHQFLGMVTPSVPMSMNISSRTYSNASLFRPAVGKPDTLACLASGMVVEYDQELLAPIGVVRDREQLRGRDVVVIEGGGAVMLVPKVGSADPRCACVYFMRVSITALLLLPDR